MPSEIRDYVARAKSDPTTDHIEALWRAVFLLKGWYFMPAQNRQGPDTPSVMMVDDHPWLVAFTNVRRLRAFARRAGRVDANGEVYLMVFDPQASLERMMTVRDRVRGVVFNPDSAATFRAPIAALIGFADHFGVPFESPQ